MTKIGQKGVIKALFCFVYMAVFEPGLGSGERIRSGGSGQIVTPYKHPAGKNYQRKRSYHKLSAKP